MKIICSLRTAWDYFAVQILNTYNSYIHGNEIKLYNLIKYFEIWVSVLFMNKIIHHTT